MYAGLQFVYQIDFTHASILYEPLARMARRLFINIFNLRTDLKFQKHESLIAHINIIFSCSLQFSANAEMAFLLLVTNY